MQRAQREAHRRRNVAAKIQQEKGEDTQEGLCPKVQTQFNETSKAIAITQGYQRGGESGALLACRAEEGLPKDKEDPIGAMAFGKGIQPTPGDLSREKQRE